MTTFLATSTPEGAEQPGANPRRRKNWDPDGADRAVATILGLASFVAYWRTLAHGLLVDDSAEFQTMARLFGHTHPTGYEVYTFAAGLSARIPIGEVATRVTAWSAVAAALTVVGVFGIVRQLGGGRVGATAGAVSLALGTTFWSQAVIAEVYSTGLLLAVIIIGATLRWDGSGDRRWLVVAGLAGGLSLGVHFTNGLFIPGIGVLLVLGATDRYGSIVSIDGLNRVIKPAVFGALCGVLLSLAAFVVVDLVDPPSQYFDAVIGPSSSAWDLQPNEIDGITERIRFDWTARQFRNQMFSDPGRLMPQRWHDVRTEISAEFSIVALVVAVVGAAAVVVRSRRWALFIGLSLVAQLFYAFNYEIGELVYVFYLPAYLLLATLFGTGIDTVGRAASRAVPGPAAWAISAAVGLVAVAPVAALHSGHVVSGTTPDFDFDGYPSESGTEAIVAATIADLPQDAVVLTDWGLLYTYVYVAHIELERSDLVFHETKPADDSDELAQSLFDYVKTTSTQRPVYISEYEDQFRAAGFELFPARIGPTRMFRIEEE